jgi:hypothetical protein
VDVICRSQKWRLCPRLKTHALRRRTRFRDTNANTKMPGALGATQLSCDLVSAYCGCGTAFVILLEALAKRSEIQGNLKNIPRLVCRGRL